MVLIHSLSSVAMALQSDPQPLRAYRIKAAFLYNFAKFVEWPPEAFDDEDSTLVLGVLGDDPFGAALQSLTGKTVRGRRLTIKILDSLPDPEEKKEVEKSVDQAVLDQLRELNEHGEPDILTELIDLFLRDTPPRLVALKDAIKEGDAQALSQTAHTLKGSSASLGATRLAALNAELEKKASHGSLEEASRLLAQLDNEFERVRHVLESKRLPPS